MSVKKRGVFMLLERSESIRCYYLNLRNSILIVELKF